MLKIAITVPGCSGKTTIMHSSKFLDFIKKNNFKLIEERNYDSENWYIKMLNGQLRPFESEVNFFRTQKEDICNSFSCNQNIIFDRHMVDTFIYTYVHKLNNLYNDEEIKLCDKLEKDMLAFLENNKLDLLIIITASNFEKIKNRRIESAKKEERRKLENKFMDMYQKFYEQYDKEKWIKHFNKYAKKVLFINNDFEIEESINILINEINNLIKK
ncbi:hypothetical protein [Mycoplasma elephantis]|uniref:hypothetical protein n=1 Tax=Mycoplasma elephantis TaxID=114882 RepID=UPI0004801A6F|nr:hypothetical protein [Mycoplasma elephantis]